MVRNGREQPCGGKQAEMRPDTALRVKREKKTGEARAGKRVGEPADAALRRDADFCAAAEEYRTVDNDLYLGMLKGLLEEGKSVSVTVSGGSMTPFVIHLRDTVFLEPASVHGTGADEDPASPHEAGADKDPAPGGKRKRRSDLTRGDVVFYQRPNGMYVLHRIVRTAPDGTYVLCGDAQTVLEPGVRREQIFARVSAIRRKGKIIKPGSFFWFFFAQIWSRVIPFRQGILKLYAMIRR